MIRRNAHFAVFIVFCFLATSVYADNTAQSVYEQIAQENLKTLMAAHCKVMQEH